MPLSLTSSTKTPPSAVDSSNGRPMLRSRCRGPFSLAVVTTLRNAVKHTPTRGTCRGRQRSCVGITGCEHMVLRSTDYGRTAASTNLNNTTSMKARGATKCHILMFTTKALYYYCMVYFNKIIIVMHVCGSYMINIHIGSLTYTHRYTHIHTPTRARTHTGLHNICLFMSCCLCLGKITY